MYLHQRFIFIQSTGAGVPRLAASPSLFRRRNPELIKANLGAAAVNVMQRGSYGNARRDVTGCARSSGVAEKREQNNVAEWGKPRRSVVWILVTVYFPFAPAIAVSSQEIIPQQFGSRVTFVVKSPCVLSPETPITVAKCRVIRGLRLS